MDFPCPAAENEQSSSNTQPAQAMREPVELHQNSSGTGPEEPVSLTLAECTGSIY